MADKIIEEFTSYGSFGSVVSNEGGYGYLTELNSYTISISSDSAESSKTGTIVFNSGLESINIPRKATIKTICFDKTADGWFTQSKTPNVSNYNSTASGSISIEILYNNTSFSVIAGETITNTNFINYITNYFKTHGVLPSDVQIRFTSTIYKPSTYVDDSGNTKNSTTIASIFIKDIFKIVYEVPCKSFILRPSSDIAVKGDTTTYSLSKYGLESESDYYRYVNEEVSDGNVTYLHAGQEHDSEKIVFGLSGDLPSAKQIAIYGMKCYCSLKVDTYGSQPEKAGGCAIFNLLLNGEYPKQSSLPIDTVYVGDGDSNGSYTLKNAMWDINSVSIKTINEHILNNGINGISDINLEFYCDNAYSSILYEPIYEATTSVSQIYLEVLYDVSGYDIYKKSDNSWLQATKAYQKQNGAWVEITEDQCKSILKNATVVTKGG